MQPSKSCQGCLQEVTTITDPDNTTLMLVGSILGQV